MLSLMAIDSILSLIDTEIARLTHVRSLLSSTAQVTTNAPGPKAKKSVGRPRKTAKRTLSPEARKRIAEAQRKRWAAQKAK